jgi:tripartite-type tricarboxylate transporter receptor subunit TctC
MMINSIVRATALALLCLAAPAALAQAWPAKPIRFVVPFPPAGATDILARFIAEKLAPVLGQQVVIENRAGAAGAVGTELVAKSAPDGHTILMATAAQSISETLYTKQPFSFARDLVPVALVARVPNVMEVHPSLPVRTVEEFIALAKSRPRQINFASSGAGTTLHMSGEMFKLLTGVDILHVPYKGSALALTGILSGEASVMWDNLPASMPYIKSGRLRAVAITTLTRYPGLPNLPTIAESGVPGYDSSAWFGVVAPAGTPPAIVARLNAEINRAVGLADMRERFAQQGALPASGTPEEFGAFILSEIAKWAKVVKASGAKVE